MITEGARSVKKKSSKHPEVFLIFLRSFAEVEPIFLPRTRAFNILIQKKRQSNFCRFYLFAYLMNLTCSQIFASCSSLRRLYSTFCSSK